MNRFPVEITFEGVKYTFQISRLGPSLLELAIADKKCLGIFQERRASAFDPTLPYAQSKGSFIQLCFVCFP